MREGKKGGGMRENRKGEGRMTLTHSSSFADFL
jgi:hypothetical protein